MEKPTRTSSPGEEYLQRIIEKSKVDKFPELKKDRRDHTERIWWGTFTASQATEKYNSYAKMQL